jgi:pimeloyl-ACP methyl ester carboxylesterase
MPGAQAGIIRAMRALLSVAALLAAAITSAAITSAAAAPAGAAPAGAAAAMSRQGLPGAPSVPVLSWRSCDGGFQCATARVPLDYRHPHGAMISIAVIRHLASDRRRFAGTLFINGGGPSAQIEPFVEAEFPLIPAAIRERFDVMTFDPRGFGFSTAVRCFPTAAAEDKFLGGLPPFPVGARQDAVWERTYARFDALCAQRNGSLLDHDTTADVARDMNLLRQAVGAPRLNYIGLSYGTGLGATYANLFPAAVGHVVLDGNLNPVTWTSGGSLPDSLREDSDLASAAAMRSFLDLCGKAATAACAFSAGTPAATEAKFATLLHRLLLHPVTIGTPPQTYTYADAIAGVPLDWTIPIAQGTPFSTGDWQTGAVVLQQLWNASATSPRAATSHAPSSGAASANTPYAGPEQTYAVYCDDTADPRSPRDYAAAARLAYARAGGFGLDWTWPEEACADWPDGAARDRYTGPWNRRTASPILVIGNTGDSNTPYQDSVAMSRDLARARLLTVDGYGHTEFLNPSTCATNYEISYLTTGALPPPGTVCAQNGTPFPG